MWKNFLRILLSRIRKQNNSRKIQERIDICLKCPKNSLNLKEIPLKKKILIYLSDFYSQITGQKQKDNKGNCTACDSCSVYYKAREGAYEDCPENRWKKW